MAAAKKTWQYLAGLSASGGALAAGAFLGWSSPVQKEIMSGDAYDFKVSENEFSWVGSLVTLGAATVCIPIGFVIRAFGRKPTMIVLVIPFLIGWLLLIFAFNVYFLYIARFILGMSGGAFCICAPMYTTEICEKEIRGTLGSFFQMLLVTGVLYGYFFGAIFHVLVFNVACAILPIIFVVFFFFMPESPVYLLTKDKVEAAQKSMAFLRGKDYDSGPEIKELQDDIAKSKANPVSLGAALTRKVTLKALGISIALMAFQQLSGINAVIFYSTDIFSGAKSGISPAVSTVLIGVTMAVFTFVSLFLIDRLGRRLLLMGSALLMAIMTFLLGLFFVLKAHNPKSVESITWLPLLSVLLFIVVFSLGYGATPWLVMAEIFAPEIKDIAGPISGTTNWLFAFIVTKLFVYMKEGLGTGGAFWVFTVITILGIVFVFFIVPETKGKSLPEIQAELEGKKE